MKRSGNVITALVLAATLTIGCGGGSGDSILKIVTQGEVETCLTDSMFLLLIMGEKLDDIIDEIDGLDRPNITVTNTSGNTWTFDCTFSVAGFGAEDTRVTGTVVLPDPDISPGDLIEFNDVVIASLGGPITGTADVDVEIGDGSVTIFGDVNIRDASADCDISLSMPTGFTIEQLRVPLEERSLTAELGFLNIFGAIGFTLDFSGFPDIGGTATVSDLDQDVTVSTETFGDFTFQLLADTQTLGVLIPCLFDFDDTINELVRALAEVVDEATGEFDSEFVTLEGSNFIYDDGTMMVNGTLTLVPPTLTFTFQNEELGTSGQSEGPILVGLSSPTRNGSINGLITIGSVEERCTGSLAFLNTRFPDESFDDFVGGRTLLTVELGGDEMVLSIDWSAEGTGGNGENDIDLDGVVLRLNGVALPPIAIVYLLTFFGFDT